MRRLLLGIATLLFLLSTAVSGQFRRSGLTKMGETLDVGLAVTDTVFLIADNFLDGNLDNWTEVGNVSVVPFGGSNVLKVNVEGGGNDYILKTIPSCNESGLRMRVYLSDTDTLGWADAEYITVARLYKNGTDNGRAEVRVILTSGNLTWRLSYYDDGGSGASTNGNVLSTNTWYSLKFHMTKATAAGADDGICNLEVDGVADVINITNWDNDAVEYDRCMSGGGSATLDCIYYIRDVVLWSNEGLP